MTGPSLYFNDKDGHAVVLFSELLYSPHPIMDRFRVNITLQKDGFLAHIPLDLERGDLIMWRSTMKDMYERDSRYATIHPVGDRFKLLCELFPTGHVQVDVQLTSALFTSKLAIRFTTDRTHLLPVIDSLTTILEMHPASVRG
jgi:hypothetical protein